MSIPHRRRIYLVRHGAVEYFTSDGRPVRPDEVSLSAVGREQARALASLLADEPIDRVVCSGLPRTRETAELALGDRALRVDVDTRFEEIRPGLVTDLSTDNVRRLFVSAFSNGISRDDRFVEGEAYGEFLDRVLPAFEALRSAGDWSTLLLVAHGGVNRAILLDLLGVGLAGFGTLEQDAGALNVIDVDPRGGAVLRLVNYTSYSPVKAGMRVTTMEQLFLDFIERARGSE